MIISDRKKDLTVMPQRRTRQVVKGSAPSASSRLNRAIMSKYYRVSISFTMNALTIGYSSNFNAPTAKPEYRE